jgi:hypothetical protein
MRFKERIRDAVKCSVAKAKLSRLQLSESLLIDSGFTKDGADYILADLKIYVTNIGFYYPNENGVLTKIKHAQALSDLVYGKKKYYGG